MQFKHVQTMENHLHLIFRLSYGILLSSVAEACFRTSTGNKSSQTVQMEYSDITTVSLNHRLPCTDDETYDVYCLNGGSCFATDMGSRTTQCACTREFMGSRCELRNPFIITFEQKVVDTKEVSGAMIASICIICVVLVILIVWLCWACVVKRK